MASAMELHQTLLQGKLKRFTRRFLPQPQTPQVAIRIESGLHKDAQIDLSRAAFSIGAANDCDLVLLDDGIAETHAKVSVNNSLLGRVIEVTPMQPGVGLNGTALPPAQSSQPETLPAHLTVGGVTVKVSDAGQDPASVLLALNDRIMRLCLVALMFFTILLGMDLAAGPPDLSPDSSALQTAYTTELEAKPLPEEELRARLVADELLDDLTLTQVSPNSILVAGTLTEPKLKKWKNVHLWFDAQFGDVLLTSNVHPAPVIDDFPAIAAVRLGENKQVRFMNGKVARVGETVHGNWVVDTIDAKGLVVRSGPSRMKISF